MDSEEIGASLGRKYKKKQGWIRLFVVLSIAWMIGVSIHDFLDYRTVLESPAPKPAPRENEGVIVPHDSVSHESEKTLLGKWLDDLLWSKERFFSFVILLLAFPLAVIMVVAASQWVRKGFKNQRGKPR